VDGSHELALAVWESAGGICAAVGFLGSVDFEWTASEAQTCFGREFERYGRVSGREGGAGAYRDLSANEMNTQIWIAILVGLAAMIDDLARRHIANWIPAAALAGGFGWQIGRDGWHGAWTALLGALVGFGVFLIFYLLGGMGGGDVKLMSGFGALLGTTGVLEAALWTAGVGGVFALVVLGWKTLRKKFTGNASRTLELSDEQKLKESSIPYAPAIAFGVWLSLIPKG
jgi:prepilin peptidase CpaA